ncbi:MAG: LysR family transcriptional regulator [Chitinivibrionales bacterium]|nr:LysR family transcriptional regulator [Chitinivibrionales bacterium]
MNLESAKVFCDLVELKNFSRTAELHGISQSAVSQQLAQLEMAHKTQLINRKKRPIEMTHAGQTFYRACKDILQRYDQLHNELSALSKTTCKINLASIFSIGMHILQPYVKKFMSIYPDVNLAIEYLDAKEIYVRLLKGSIDIGVVAMPRRDRSINVYSFENEPLAMVCSPEHPFSLSDEIDIHHLQGERFIAFAENVPTRQCIDNILKRFGISVHVVMEFDNIETIKRAIEINSGISILPKTTIMTELNSGSLKSVAFSNEHFYRSTGIVVRKDRQLNKAAQYLVELLRKGADRDL